MQFEKIFILSQQRVSGSSKERVGFLKKNMELNIGISGGACIFSGTAYYCDQNN